MKKLLVVTAIVAALGAGYVAGYAHADREARSVALGHALESAALCANGLLTQTRTSTILEHRLRSAVESAEQLTRAGARIDMPIPNLVDGLRRAKLYADRVGDTQLSARLAALHEQLAQSQ